jgi:hypothetical protein
MGVPCNGHLIVRTDPPRAELHVDGKKVESPTPTSVDKLCIGKHRVTLTLAQHKTVEREIEVREGVPTELTLSLTLLTSDVSISAPDGADVYLDGQRAGQAPLTLSNIPWGQHRIRVQKSGFVTQERTVNVDEPKVSYTFPLVADVCQGTLIVRSEPGDARVLLNGQEIGDKTPALLRDMACGMQRVKLTLAGYRDAEEVVEIKNRSDSRVNVALVKEKGRLRISSTPSGADIYVGTRKVGTTPDIFSDISFGTYRVRLEKDGYTTEERTITVARPSQEEDFYLSRVQPAKIPLAVSTFGYEATGGIQTFLTLGLLMSQYAIEVAGQIVGGEWRIRSFDNKIELEPGDHRFRILMRHGIAREPIVAYEGRVQVSNGGQNKLDVNFLAHTVTINGYTDWFKKDMKQ